MTTTSRGRRDSGNPRTAWLRLHADARMVADYQSMRKLCRTRRRLLELGDGPQPATRARVALLSGATTEPLVEPLQLALEAAGIDAVLHTTPYNTYAREMLDPGSDTVRFAPDMAVIVTTTANMPVWPSITASAQEVDALVDEAVEYWLGLCRSLHTNIPSCDIILANFHPLPLRPLGTAATRTPGEGSRFLRAVNEQLSRRSPEYVHIHDVESLASLHGVYRWFDHRFWYHAKQPVSFECLVPYVRNVARIIAALRGRSAKCLVVDLDNTIWGGVVGDEGPDRIVIGEGDARGEAFAAFQHYLVQLKARGVILAVASKNEESNALEPFRIRPEMVLKRDDFLVFRANWSPKSDNVREIARLLNIGLDSIVFVDDNPAEREEVRQALPEVRVLEIGDEPADYPLLLDQTGWFDTVTLSTEDRDRSTMYSANAARGELRSTMLDYDDYLRSLEQRAVIAPFQERFLDRITQLTNKTNQFNLTTRRLTRSQLAAMMDSESYLTASVHLTDRFGNNGLISVLAARGEGADLWIELWLMSCRVFNRGVEHALCNHVVAAARAAGYLRVHGLYVETPRNRIVRSLFRDLGFEAADPIDGADHWVLEVGSYSTFETTITITGEHGSGAQDGEGGRAGGVGPDDRDNAGDLR